MDAIETATATRRIRAGGIPKSDGPVVPPRDAILAVGFLLLLSLSLLSSTEYTEEEDDDDDEEERGASQTKKIQ